MSILQASDASGFTADHSLMAQLFFSRRHLNPYLALKFQTDPSVTPCR